MKKESKLTIYFLCIYLERDSQSPHVCAVTVLISAVMISFWFLFLKCREKWRKVQGLNNVFLDKTWWKQVSKTRYTYFMVRKKIKLILGSVFGSLKYTSLTPIIFHWPCAWSSTSSGVIPADKVLCRSYWPLGHHDIWWAKPRQSCWSDLSQRPLQHYISEELTPAFWLQTRRSLTRILFVPLRFTNIIHVPH